MTAARLWHGLPAGLVGVGALLPLVALLAYLGVAPLLILAGLLALPVLPVLAGHLRRPPAVMVAVSGLGLWGLVSAAWAIGPDDSLETAGQLLGVAAAGWLVVLAVEHLAPRHRRALVLATGGGLAAAMAVALLDLGLGARVAALLRGGDPMVPAAYKHGLCVAAIVLPPAMLGFWPRGRYGKATALGLAGLVVAAIVIGPGGTAKVALAAGVVAAILTTLAGPRVVPAMALLAAALVVAMPLLGHALPSATTPDDRPPAFLPLSAQHRLAIWHYTAERIAERPFVGRGLEASRNMVQVERRNTYILTDPADGTRKAINDSPIPLHPHNAALQVWLELGAPGAFLLSALVLAAFAAVRRLAPHRAALAAGVFSVVAAGMVAALGYGAWQTWWMSTLALTAALLYAAFMISTSRNPGIRNSWSGCS